MWSWLQKLIRYLQGEEDEQPRSERLSLPPGQAQAKTKSIYPRERMDERPVSTTRREKERQFRFPVIPDERPRSKQREQTPVQSADQPVTVQKKSVVSLHTEKRPYKPTEVYSPIYGKLDSSTPQTVERKKSEEKRTEPPITPAAELVKGKAEAAAVSIPERVMEFGEKPSLMEPVVEPPRVERVVADQPELSNMEREDASEEPVLVEETPMVDWQPQEPIHTDNEEAHEDEVHQEPEPVKEEPAPPMTAPISDWRQPQTVESKVEPEPESQPVPVRPMYIPYQPQQTAEGQAADLGEKVRDYELPDLSLLNPSPALSEDDYEYTLEQKQLLEETLSNFHVSAQVVGIVKGPSVTRFELQPAPGVKVNKITGLIDDIKLNMAAKDIRIEAPIPGRNAVGIEVPNLKSEPIFISRIIGSEKFRSHPSPLAVALGMDIGGEPIVADIKKMPHGLIAGATGSGKSVCINSIIVSLLYKASPEQVRLLLIDPKMVELAPYNHLPHLVTPVVTDAKQATAALKWAVEEMEKRYTLFVDAGVRDIDRYNLTTDEPLPYIVIVIDELADLMMVSPQDVEDCIIRIAQKARACGIHLLLATQRPSVDVITGNIKANVPTRLAFAVFSQVDSRTILDQSGAERLLGRGDMLFLESGATPTRLQGNYVSDDEIERVTHMIKKQRKPEYYFSKEDLEQQVQSFDMGDDPLYHEALLFVADQGQASASGLQRRFRIGYNRAARLIEMMEAEGHVAGQSGGKPRAVLITREDAQALAEGSTLL